jgi:hypothetical protein
MFKFSQLKQIHLEITNNCQASCPMCSRNINGGLDNPLIKITNWTLDEFKHIMNKDVLEQIGYYYFCGNFGDPMLNNDLIDMCAYVTETAPTVGVSIHTNGSLRSEDWWRNLAKSMPQNHAVVFALDGLEDTHHLYRVGTDFNKIINNAKAFMEAGGIAHWVFIRFKHNEHQVEEARQMAKDLGFSEFILKNSSRFMLEPRAKVVNRNNEFMHYVEPATDTPMKFIDKKTIDSFESILDNVQIDCIVKKNKEVFIDAHKNLFPCCHTGYVPYNEHAYQQTLGAIGIVNKIVNQHYDMVHTLGDMNVMNSSIKDIIDSEPYQTAWDEYWGEKKLIICARTCGVSKDIEFSRPRDQWKK